MSCLFNTVGHARMGSTQGVAALVLLTFAFSTTTGSFTGVSSLHRVPVDAQEILSRCVALKTTPGPSQEFHDREVSDRFEEGTNATLIRNCTIFTGEKNGTVVIHGDILLDKGIVKGLGKVSRRVIDNTPNLTLIEANGAWVTPGLVDLHSHLGLLSAPILAGAFDVNSPNGPVLPWLRSIDGLNTHDDAYALSIAGGVTSAQILPGSGNAIGGQAFIIKLRKTSERSPSSMVVEPPHTLTGNSNEGYSPFRWRHMKQACGENLIRYGTRMDSMWSFRSAYNEARKVKNMQDAYCAKAEAGLWGALDGPFPESYQWEMLVDVLRGKVKISNHCYEAVDLDNIVRLTNEFQFPIASFHHASEAYLVPDVLKKAWGGTPAAAIFATNHRYKREAFRGSEFAARILADEGIPVVMKTDHPVINARYLIHEAQQAHHFSLPPHLALASVTSTPATIAGLSHRIGILAEGTDADVVMWDSHPLRIGATPVKVWIDGIVQIPVPSKTDEKKEVEVGKGKEGEEWKEAPQVPNWDKERNQTLKWDGLPPLEGRRKGDRIVFTNVKQVWNRGSEVGVEEVFSADGSGSLGSVTVENGRVTCMGVSCAQTAGQAEVVDLKGGSISPGLMTYGSTLGLEEIRGEPSTGDGEPYDAFQRNIPKILDDVGGIVRAMDGLMFGTRNALLAYRSGVTLSTTSLAKPAFLFAASAHLISGLSTTFRTGAAHAMESGAIVQDVVALHVVVGKAHPIFSAGAPSVSTQIATLRRLLYGWESNDQETGVWFQRAAEGVVPLVIEVDSADIMASLLIVKAEVENNIGSRMRMVFSGATEAHLLAKEISDADVGVILSPARPFPMVWDQRRILAGPPLTNDTSLVTLLREGVIVALGARDAALARNTRFDLEWAALESNGRINQRQAYAMATTDLEKLLGVRGVDQEGADMVAFEGGGMFDISSKVVAVISPRREFVDLF
ncbi:carbohydrate esterase family 9 protein [Crucibulum laeve]|uniref:Carbohydrate esterase family 9 protein n=1 Tax=Crucibulum laeve TaxID=68775 RepID=A0A5C3MEF6_9AGAR|nr:carbohydrate esterase family 9 protein [Crucibulum laeve]